ncbi:MAG: hypothetical protein ACKVOT_12765 [Polaromonas sp.]
MSFADSLHRLKWLCVSTEQAGPKSVVQAQLHQYGWIDFVALERWRLNQTA